MRAAFSDDLPELGSWPIADRPRINLRVWTS
jgi:hypothetical protein